MLVKITEEASQAGSMSAQTYPQCRTARSLLSLLKERYWMTRTASAHASASAAKIPCSIVPPNSTPALR